MKIIYFGSIATTDCDFPLLRSYLQKGLDVVAYFTLADRNKKAGLICVDEMKKEDIILKASDIEAFKRYESYLNLDKVFVINSYHYRRNQWQSWVLWLKVLIHIYRQKANIIHFVWPPSKQGYCLYLLPLRRVLTVHDPFPHSSGVSTSKEKSRLKAFKKCDKIVLLNKVQLCDFLNTYKIRREKVILNHLGEYDCLRIVHNGNNFSEQNYILYFGQIQSHKGVEFLLDAMIMLHESHPEIKLIVAGNGNYYFDVKPYECLDYIEFRNRYIPVPELATLLQKCLFAVCPYKDATQSGVVQTAFSVNVPLIVTDVGALPEVVKDGIYGIVVPPCDSKAISEAMTNLIESPELLNKFRENINNQWRPTMSWDPIAEKNIEMYKSLLNE